MELSGSEVEHKLTYAAQKANAVVSCRPVTCKTEEWNTRGHTSTFIFQLLDRSWYLLSLYQIVVI